MSSAFATTKVEASVKVRKISKKAVVLRCGCKNLCLDETSAGNEALVLKSGVSEENLGPSRECA